MSSHFGRVGLPRPWVKPPQSSVKPPVEPMTNPMGNSSSLPTVNPINVIDSAVQLIDNSIFIRIFNNLIDGICIDLNISDEKKNDLINCIDIYGISFPEYCQQFQEEEEDIPPNPILEALAPLVIVVRDYVWEHSTINNSNGSSIIDALPCSDSEKDELKKLKKEYGKDFGKYCICFANGNESDNIWLASMADLSNLKVYVS